MLKKSLKLSTLTLAMGLTAPLANADILGFYLGGGLWNNSFSGDIGIDNQPATLDELGLDEDENIYLYAALEHPIPVIPNVRIAVSNMSTEGSAIVTRQIEIDEDFTIDAMSPTTTKIDLGHTDITLYWELLDTLVNLDLGFTARVFDGEAEFRLQPGGSGSIQKQSFAINGALPMLYVKGQLDLALTGWYVGGTLNYVGINKNSVSDLEAKFGYMTSGLGLDIGFEAGYRQMSLQIDEDDELEVDASVDGLFLGAVMHF